MKGQLELTVLGKPQIKWQNQPLTTDLISAKGQALLIYLAVTRQSYSRSALAGLLWGDMLEEVARANLRLTLSKLRKAISHNLLTITRQSVAFNFSQSYWLDVACFEALTAQLDQGDIEKLQAARQRQDFAEGIELARHILSLEPWHEEAHRQLIWFLAHSGQRSLALSQYETCRRLLAEELDVEPALETVALYEQIKAGEFSPAPPALLPTSLPPPPFLARHNLPFQLTPFIGREMERALAYLERPLPQTRPGWLLHLLRQLLRQAAHRLTPTLLGTGEVEKCLLLLEEAQTLGRLGQIFYFAGEKLRTLTTALYHLNLAEQIGPSPELAEAYATIGITAGTIPLHRLARLYHTLAYQMIQDIDKVATKAYISELNGVYRCGICHWAKAKTAIEQAAALFDQLELRNLWAQCWSLLGKTDYYRGNFIQAMKYFTDLLSATRQYGDLSAQHWALVGQAEAAMRLGQIPLEQILAWLDRANSLPANYPGYTQNIRFYGVLALAHFRCGNHDLARQAAQTSLQFIKRGGLVGFWAIEGYAGVAETFLTLWENEINLALSKNNPKSASALRAGPGEIGNLKSEAGRACQALHSFARIYTVGQPRAWLHQGLYEWLAGKPAKAHQAWRKSLAAAEQLGMPYEQGRAYYELGRHLSAQQESEPGQSRQALLQRACDIFAKLEASPDLARARAALDGVAYP